MKGDSSALATSPNRQMIKKNVRTQEVLLSYFTSILMLQTIRRMRGGSVNTRHWVFDRPKENLCLVRH